MRPKELRAVRRKLGLSRERLAAQLGVTSQTIYIHEKGLRKPSPLVEMAWRLFMEKHPELAPKVEAPGE